MAGHASERHGKNGVYGGAYRKNFGSIVSCRASDGTMPYAFSLESAPSWLPLEAAGAPSGTRPAATATVKATDSAATAASKSIMINVGAVAPTSDSDIPATGGSNMPALWIETALLSAAGLAAGIAMHRRKRRSKA